MGKLIELWIKSDRFRIIALIIMITILGGILLNSQSHTHQWKNHPSDFGSRDFIAFWSAFHALKDGNNPYSMSALYPFQRQLVADEESTQAFLNPPWSLVVLAPVLVFDFPMARVLWIGLNALFIYLTITLIISYLHGKDSSRIIHFIAASLFLPSIWTVWMGQVTLFLTLCFVAAFTAMMKGRTILAGLIFIPLTLKPHLFLVVGIVLAVYVLRKKHLSLVISFVCGFLSLQFITYLLSPQIYSNWLNMDYSPLIQKTSSLVTMIRESVLLASGALVDWPIFVVPVIGVMLCLPWLLKRYGNSDIELLVPASLCISLGIAPYAWLQDFSLLLICQSTLLVLVSKIKHPYVIGLEVTIMLVILQLAILITIAVFQMHKYLFLVPWVMLAIWVRSSNLLYAAKTGHV
ncbi:MAG: glycosyltransferase family 87 protein [Candidatus Sedimenticola sp. (ex Thyasira tokunagai)]